MLNKLGSIKSATQEIFDIRMKEIRGYQVMQDNIMDRLRYIAKSDIMNASLKQSMININNGYVGGSIFKAIYDNLVEEYTKKYGKDFEINNDIKTDDEIELINDLSDLYVVLECVIMLGITDIISQYCKSIFTVTNLDAVFHNRKCMIGFIRDMISCNDNFNFKLIKIFAENNDVNDFVAEDLIAMLNHYVLFDKRDQTELINSLRDYKDMIL